MPEFYIIEIEDSSLRKKSVMYNIEGSFKNAISFLPTLMESLARLHYSEGCYLHNIGNSDRLQPDQNHIQIGGDGIDLLVTPEFFQQFGIRALGFYQRNEELSHINLYFIVRYKESLAQRRWYDIKKDEIIYHCRLLLRHCRIISFENWSSVYDATELWDGFLRDIIKPMGRTDFEFIFYIGDISKKLVFETDEILDIISEYSRYGKVTLVLDQQEAMQLSNVMSGEDKAVSMPMLLGSNMKKEYVVIFNGIQIAHLLIQASDGIISIGRDHLFELMGDKSNSYKSSGKDRLYFNTGYSLGLLLKLDMPQCIALGMVVSGAYEEHGTGPYCEILRSYIGSWAAASSA